MRTKTLLVAAATLAVAAISSRADTTVYSQNIVGYVNATLPSGQYALVVAPLQATNVTENAEQVLPSVQASDSVLLWNGSGYDNYVYTGSPGLWVGPSGPGPAPTLNAGQAFFYLDSQAAAETNTFTGTVALTNSVTFQPGAYSLVGSIAPIGVPIDNTNIDLPVQASDSVLLWNGSGYDNYVYTGSPGLWVGPSGPGAAPSVTVGQGFFYLNSQASPEQWNQNVVVQ